MEVARCPECGHELSLDDITSKHVRLAIAAGGVIASASVADIMLTLPKYPDAAREGFDERLGEVTETLHETTDAISEWAEAYDEEE